jgi:hypothetical protein
MAGPFDPAAAAAMAGAYQLGGMPGSDPYAAAAFGMQPQPDPAMFQAYQHANGATLATLMRPNGGTPGGANAATSAVAAQSGSGNAVTTTPAGPPTNSASQINGKQGTAQQTEGDSIANVNTIDKGEFPGKPNPALLGSQLFASFMG